MPSKLLTFELMHAMLALCPLLTCSQVWHKPSQVWEAVHNVLQTLLH